MEGTSGPSSNKKPSKQPRNPNKDHILRKRRPQKPDRDETAVYVSTKTPIKATLEQCNKLINRGEKELTIYGIGAAIQRGILVALRLCEEHVAFQIHTNTFTTELIDDLEPGTEDADFATQRRMNSGIKIRVFKTD